MNFLCGLAKAAYDGLNRVTLSGLLNCLDGVTSTEARILFMTTNYLDRLDPALIRPGRVDVKEYIGYCSKHQLGKGFGGSGYKVCVVPLSKIFVSLGDMFLKFYPEANELLAAKFVEGAVSLGKKLSPAAVQGHFLFFKGQPHAAIENINRLS